MRTFFILVIAFSCMSIADELNRIRHDLENTEYLRVNLVNKAKDDK